MSKTWHRIVGMLLALVMVAGLLPVGAAADEQASVLYEQLPGATELVDRTVTVTEDVHLVEVQEDGVRFGKDDTITRTYELPETEEEPGAQTRVSTFSITEAETYNGYQFTTFEDLQNLAADSYSEYTEAVYTGTEPLEIASSLRLPERLHLLLPAMELIVPEGVEFAAASDIDAGKVTINGVAQIAALNVRETLTVNGELQISSEIYILVDTVVTGAENITFTNSWARFAIRAEVTTEAEMATAIAAANAMENARCNLSVSESVTISGSICVPQGSSLNVYEGATLTVAEGGSLENDGSMNISGNLVVSGALINNNRLSIAFDQGGRVEIAAGGSFSGNGCVVIMGETITDATLAISGLDLENYEVKEYYDYSHFLELWYVAGMTKLAAPVNPEWGYDHEVWVGYDEENDKPIFECVATPGMISWQPQEPTQAQTDIWVYREGETQPYKRFGWGFGSTDLPEWRSVDSFCNEDPESGTYYFTVQSKGDYVNYFDSDIVKSDTWTYVKPSVQLGSCSDLSWNWPAVTYSAPADKSYVAGYEVEWYFSPTADGTPQNYGATWNRYMFEGEIFRPEVHDEMLQECGVGYYYFKVRALSSDITVACNSAWSELSPAFNLGELTGDVKDNLQDVVQNSGNLSDDEIRDAVQGMDTEDLKTAMLADEDVLDDIAVLEDQVGGAAEVEVTDDASAFDSSKVSIVGANLNNAESATDPIKLVIDKPEKEHVLDAAYDNAVAVNFSMDLDNVADTQNLEVPVKITLPIPETINPGFLVILHYHVDGTVEELMVGDRVYVFTKNGQKYASFVLDSFSDFTMTQQAEKTDIPTMHMFRMYDPNGHEHFYTGSEEERENLVTAGWNYEGVGFTFPLTTGDPVYRLYDRNNTCEHLYTMDEAEKSALMDAGWEYEGIAFNSADSTQVPQYRLHNPNETRGAYHFTADLEERDHLISLGWEYQGIGWYSCWQ